MPCEKIVSPDGTMVGFVCSRGRQPRKLCHYCGKPAMVLCDYPLGNGKTCDKPMCNSCRTKIGPNLDVCREHRNPADIATALKGSDE